MGAIGDSERIMGSGADEELNRLRELLRRLDDGRLKQISYEALKLLLVERPADRLEAETRMHQVSNFIELLFFEEWEKEG